MVQRSIMQLAVLLLLGSAELGANRLEERLGRNESRVYGAPYAIVPGPTVTDTGLPRRLERLGYRRVHERPELIGEFFWGHEIFWIHRRAGRFGGHDHKARLIGLRLRRADGKILGLLDASGQPSPDGDRHWLEPELLSESLAGDRARRHLFELDEVPEHVWRTVLAAEDARFFDHGALDARSLARATIANLKSGKVVQGGSTITQQLIKNRDLSPRRSMGRKASEAIRAMALEEEFSKKEILESYLNLVYFGHREGLAIHGLGTASRAFFSLEPRELDLARAATLAAMIQGPNRLSPVRDPDAVKVRRDWVLGRMEELGWALPSEVARARRAPIRTRLESPTPPVGLDFLGWVADLAREKAPKRSEKGRGMVAETTLDPWLQEIAERVVEEGLAELRRRHRQLKHADLGVALVALEAGSGEVRAYVGGNPAEKGDRFDRVRLASRQPGSTVKPLLLLEAFERCGARRPLYPATRVLDEPLSIPVPGEPWEPVNPDGRFRGTMTIRESLVHSLNIPFVRVARHCGFGDTARTLAKAGLRLPDEPPPAFTLGAIEVTPLELATAYGALASDGRRPEALAIPRLERPAGRRLEVEKTRRHRVASEETAYLVNDLLRDVVEKGTAQAVSIDGLELSAKTGTSSNARDAWLAGYGRGLVVVVWVGRDDGKRLGLSGSKAAAPIWRSLMAEALPALPPKSRHRPEAIVEKWIHSETGLRVSRRHRQALLEVFDRRNMPPRARFWRTQNAIPVVR